MREITGADAADMKIRICSGRRETLVNRNSNSAGLRNRLAQDRILLVPSVYDSLSARLAGHAGHEAVFVGGYCVAASRNAMPDLGLLGLAEMVEHTGRIVDASSLIVFADGDTGYGAEANIRRTVRDHAKAGASAIMIEDQTWPKRCGHMDGKNVVERSEAVARIRAAVAARDELDSDILILARTDSRGVLDFDEAMWRMAAFEDQGADILFLEAPLNRAELERFAGGFTLPCMANVLHGGVTPVYPARQLEEMGFSIIAYATAVLGAAALAVQRTLLAIRHDEEPEDLLSHADLQAILTPAD